MCSIFIKLLVNEDFVISSKSNFRKGLATFKRFRSSKIGILNFF